MKPAAMGPMAKAMGKAAASRGSPKQWIAKAITKPGALRATAKRPGFLKGDGPLTKAVLDRLEAHGRAKGDKKLLKSVAFARTLAKMRTRR